MLHRIMPLALSLVLALALVVGGLARGLAQPGEADFTAGLAAMVICADGGTATVVVDAQGTVIDPDQPCLLQHCSQCLLAGAAALPNPDTVAVLRRAVALPPHPVHNCPAVIRQPLRVVARGPPPS